METVRIRDGKKSDPVNVKVTEGWLPLLFKSVREQRGFWAQYGGREASRGVRTRVYMEEAYRNVYI
jgi:hypothetical protein